MEQREAWRPIKGYGSKYLVSSFGRVKCYNSNKEVVTKGGTDSRLKLRLISENGTKQITLKRLVFDTFVITLKSRVEINHIDGNNQNCRLDNLYVTRNNRLLFNGANDIEIKEITIPTHKEFIIKTKYYGPRPMTHNN
jgi:hypothetical protein